jgi:hypothetical protein
MATNIDVSLGRETQPVSVGSGPLMRQFAIFPLVVVCRLALQKAKRTEILQAKVECNRLLAIEQPVFLSDQTIGKVSSF